MEHREVNWQFFLKQGNEASFSAIYSDFVDELYSYGISLGFQKDTCKDAIQDIFINIFISRKKLMHVENISGYIFRSFKNRLIDIERKNHGKDSIDSFDEKLKLEVTTLDTIIDSETAGLLKEKIERLLNNITPKERQVVYLKYVAGLKHKEIAHILEIHEDSARKILYRAMGKLRKIASDEDLPEKLVLLIGIHQLCQII